MTKPNLCLDEKYWEELRIYCEHLKIILEDENNIDKSLVRNMELKILEDVRNGWILYTLFPHDNYLDPNIYKIGEWEDELYFFKRNLLLKDKYYLEHCWEKEYKETWKENYWKDDVLKRHKRIREKLKKDVKNIKE